MECFLVSIVFARSFSRNLLWVGDFETGDWPIQNPLTDSPQFKSRHDVCTSLAVGHSSIKPIARERHSIQLFWTIEFHQGGKIQPLK